MKNNIGPKFWATWALAGAAFEAYALHHKRQDLTGSYTTRLLTVTPVGAALFTAGWIYFATWFPDHIVNGTNTERSSS